MIFPRKITSKSITSLLDYPKANNVKTFKYTDYKLISIKAYGMIEPFILKSDDFIIVGVEREKNFFIPQTKSLEIQPNDLLYIFALDKDIKEICDLLKPYDVDAIKRCVVFGGQDLGISISKSLLETKREVKLIEKDVEFCKKADEILEGRVDVINLKYGTSTIYEDEGLDNADIFIASTDDDEYNIVKCLEAKDKGIKKIVTNHPTKH